MPGLPGLTWSSKRASIPACGQKVLGVCNPSGYRKLADDFRELSIRAVFIGRQIFESIEFLSFYEAVEVAVEGLAVVRIVKTDVDHPVTRGFKAGGKVAYSGKKSCNFLNVMRDVVRFLADFHQHVSHPAVALFKPAVI